MSGHNGASRPSGNRYPDMDAAGTVDGEQHTSFVGRMRQIRSFSQFLCAGACLIGICLPPLLSRAQDAGTPVVAVPAVRHGAVSLHTGEGRLIRLDHQARNVLVGDAAIADVQVISPTELYVYGRKPGVTTLSAVDGESGSEAQLTLDVTRSGAAAAQTLPHGSSLRVRFDGDRLLVEGPVTDLGQAYGAAATADAFNASKQPPLDQTELAGAQQVTLRVRIAEVSRSTLNQLGLNFDVAANPGSFTVGLITGSFLGSSAASALTSSIAGTGTSTSTNNFGQASAGIATHRVNANLLLNALQSEGLVTTLAEPNLTTISGQTASFLAGGEVPIPVPQALGVTTIDYKNYGVRLSFTPTLLPGERIAMRVHPSVSEISSANAVSIAGTTVPSFVERDAQSNVEMASGQTLAIAGLFQRTDQNDISKFPFLGDVPILGALFRSTSYQHNETELVILVTPYITKPVSDPDAFPLPGQPPAYVNASAPSVAAGFVAN